MMNLVKRFWNWLVNHHPNVRNPLRAVREWLRKDRSPNGATKEIPLWRTLFILSVWLGLLTFFGYEAWTYEKGTVNMNWGLVSAVILLIHIVKSIRTVDANQTGALILFGKPTYRVEQGLVFTIWPAERLETASRVSRQRQFPGEPDDIFEGDDNETIPVDPVTGKPKNVRPIRVIHIGNPEKQEADPYERPMATQVLIVVSYRIFDLPRFIQMIETTENAEKQMQDIATQVVQNELPGKTVREAILGKQAVSNRIKKSVITKTKTWGIKINDAYLERIITATKLNKSLASVPTAQVDKQKTIIDAEAQKRKDELDGEGLKSKNRSLGEAAAYSEYQLLDARAEGLKKLATDLGIADGNTVLFIQMMTTALEKSQFSLVGGNAVTDLMAMGAKIKTLIEQGRPATP